MTSSFDFFGQNFRRFFASPAAVPIPMDLSWSGHREQLAAYSDQDLKHLFDSEKFIGEIEALFLHSQQPACLQQLSSLDVLEIFADQISHFPALEAHTPPEHSLWLQAIYLLHTRAIIIRRLYGSTRILPSEPNLLGRRGTESLYVLPLLQQAHTLLQAAANTGVNCTSWRHIHINYLMVGLAYDHITQPQAQQLLADILPQQSSLSAHSLTDLGYVHLLLKKPQQAITLWQQAGTATSLALVAEEHLKNNDLEDAEILFQQALTRGNHQASIRLVETYFKRIQALYHSEIMDYSLCEQTQTAIERALRLHQQNPQAFSKEFQDGFDSLWQQYADIPIIHKMIQEQLSKQPSSYLVSKKTSKFNRKHLALAITAISGVLLLGSQLTALASFSRFARSEPQPSAEPTPEGPLLVLSTPWL